LRNLTLMIFLLFFKATSVFSGESAFKELISLQAKYLAKEKINLDFTQKSKLSEGGDFASFDGRINIDRKLKTFQWKVLKPSKLEFSIDKDFVRIKAEDSPENKMKLSDLPANFKFIKSLFAVFGFDTLDPKKWSVTKKAPYTFELKNKVENLPMKDLSLFLKKNGYPKKVSFSNSAGVSFNINFYEK